MPVPHQSTFAAACLCAAALLLMLTCAAATESAVPTPNKAADLPPPIISAPTSTGTLGTPASNHSEDGAPPHQRRAFAAAYFEIGPGAPSYVVLPGTYWVRFSNGFYLCAFDDNTMRQTPRMYGWERITVLPGPTPGTSYLYSQFHNKYIIDPVFILGIPDRAPVQSSTPIAIDTTFFTISAPREVRIGGASVNQPRAVGSYPYRIASPRLNSSAQWVEATYLRAPTTGEYEGFVYRDEGQGFVPPPEMDFASVRTLGAGDFWVRTHHGQFMCVFPQEAFLSRVRPTNAQLAWERIRVIKADEGEYGRNRYHLWSDAHQRYLAFEPNGLGVRTGAFSWETFRIVSHPKHYEKFSIFSDYHGKFLRQACNGCGFDATLSNTDGADGDVTAFEFEPIYWFSLVQFYRTNGNYKRFRFAATGKYLAFNLIALWAKQSEAPYSISTSAVIEVEGPMRSDHKVEVIVNGHAYMLRSDFNLDVSPMPFLDSDPHHFHYILPHPKMPLRYIMQLCAACPGQRYVAADPNGFDLTTTEDAASDFTAIEILF